MDFKQISKVLAQREPKILNKNEQRQYAILLPLIAKNNELHLLFQVRSSKLKSQPNDICFPGGKIEPTDPSRAAAAIRETSEELGLDPQTIGNVYPLDYIVGEMNLYPFVGQILAPEQIKLNEAEVAEIFTVPLAYLLKAEPVIHYVDLIPTPAADFPFELIAGGKNYEWRPRKMIEPFYQYEDRVIWGLTAQILYHFLAVIRAE